MPVDVLSVTLRALSFVALFQAAGMVIFDAAFGHRAPATTPLIRRYALISTWLGVVFVAAHYSLEAARMAGDYSGVTDAELQSIVLNSPTATAFFCRMAGLLLIAIGLHKTAAQFHRGLTLHGAHPHNHSGSADGGSQAHSSSAAHDGTQAHSNSAARSDSLAHGRPLAHSGSATHGDAHVSSARSGGLECGEPPASAPPAHGVQDEILTVHSSVSHPPAHSCPLPSHAHVALSRIALVGVVLVVVSFTFMGHTTDHSARWLLVALLLTHLFIVAFWFGALLPLSLATQREKASAAGALVESFSASALWLVPVLFVAGLGLAAFILGGFAALASTYGQLLLLKVAGFALLMLLASLNKWRLGPALARGNPHTAALFRYSLTAEYVLIAAVLTTTAILTTFYSPEG